jgi:predicted ATPase/DNA-binding XRE family transcriptional regulator
MPLTRASIEPAHHRTSWAVSNEFGDLLKSYRRAAGLTQESLAERSDLSVNAISALERGERQHPYPRTIEALATALGLNDEGRASLIQAAAGHLAPIADARESRRLARIPSPTSETLGRERHIAEVTALLTAPQVRLLTLTGPGGVGKTRLSQQVGASTVDRMPDGALFVPLAAITDSTLVASAIVQAVNPAADGSATPESLLQELSMLLVLDNFEQVTGAATVVASLLQHCPNVTILVTSRRPLRIDGEHEYPVPPLDVPENGVSGISLATLANVPSVALFVQRSRAVRPDFDLNQGNAAEIAALCRHLEGLPLALELAASRVKVLSPRAILANYHHRLELLTGGGPDRPTRLQTMRGAIDWSFALLSHTEQAVFRRLSVFAGSAPLEAIPAVAGGGLPVNPPMLDVLASLVDHSLLVREERPDGETSLRMLEVIREFATEQLAAAGEAAGIHTAHAHWFLDDAHAARMDFEGPNRRDAHDRFRYQMDNLRAALAWFQQHDVPNAYRLTSELARFRINAGFLDEAWTATERTLALGDPGDPLVEFDTLYWGAITQLLRGDAQSSEQLIRRGLAIARTTNNRLDTGRALGHLADTLLDSDPETARASLHEALTIFSDLHDDFREAISLRLLGLLATREGDLNAAYAYHMDALSIWERLDHRWGVPISLRSLAEIDIAKGDLASARLRLREALARWEELGERLHISDCCTVLADLAREAGLVEEAALMLGAQARLDEETGYGQPTNAYRDVVEAIQAAMTPERFQALWAEGREMSLDAALEPILIAPLPGAGVKSSS